jgi:hypothetical protein
VTGLSSLADAEHSVEWQVNLTHVVLLALALYVAWKTDLLDGGDGRESDDEAVEVALEGT